MMTINVCTLDIEYDHAVCVLCCRYGFVVYGDGTVTDVACKGLNGMRMGDRTLTVRRATEVTSPFYAVPCIQNVYFADKHAAAVCAA